jgi:hypothetical protein
MDEIKGRLLNVTLLADSEAGRAYYGRAASSLPELTPAAIAAGFPPQPSLNMTFFGGKTIADLVFVNHYLGGEGAWDAADIASIDAALAKAMSDSGLQSVIAQYYQASISSRMLPSAMLPDPAPATLSRTRWKRSRRGSSATAASATPTRAARSSTSCCRAGSSCRTASRPASSRRRAPRPSTSAA